MFETDNKDLELMRLKAQAEALSKPTLPTANVLNDISKVWNDCSTEEQHFIERDKQYLTASAAYQQEFQSFLIENFGAQFLNSKHAKSAEEVLVQLNAARKRYKDSSTSMVNQLIEQNKQLQKEVENYKNSNKVNHGDLI